MQIDLATTLPRCKQTLRCGLPEGHAGLHQNKLRQWTGEESSESEKSRFPPLGCEVAEPSSVYPEAEFEKAVVSVIEAVRLAWKARFEKRRFEILKFGLDIAVVMGSSQGSIVRLLEVKAFNGQRMGGVGFGNQQGKGPQVEILLCGDDSLRMFDSVMRWAYVDARQQVGTARYGLFTCVTAKNAAMNGVSRGKQNNFRVAALQPLVGWAEFCSQVRDFLTA